MSHKKTHMCTRVPQCRNLYDNCDDSADVEIFTAYVDGVATDIPYQACVACSAIVQCAA